MKTFDDLVKDKISLGSSLLILIPYLKIGIAYGVANPAYRDEMLSSVSELEATIKEFLSTAT